MRSLVLALVVAFAGLVPLGCAHEAPSRSLVEDQTRRAVPLPACVYHLAPRRPESAGTLRRLRDTEVVKLIFPTFDEDKRLLGAGAVACTGAALLTDASLASGKPARGSWPQVVEDADLLYGSGGDRMRVVWLRILAFDDGTVGGPLAIVRGTEHFAELFAAGTLRGYGERTTLGTQRLGSEVVVTASDDGCVGRKPGDACEKVMHLFLPRGGALRPVGDLALERVAYGGPGDASERPEEGAAGTVEYRMTASADYRDDGVHVVEQVRVKDGSGAELRVLERERLFVWNDAGALTASEPPLWDTAVQFKASKPEKPAARPRRRP